jgi:hypothetical protein
LLQLTSVLQCERNVIAKRAGMHGFYGCGRRLEVLAQEPSLGPTEWLGLVLCLGRRSGKQRNGLQASRSALIDVIQHRLPNWRRNDRFVAVELQRVLRLAERRGKVSHGANQAGTRHDAFLAAHCENLEALAARSDQRDSIAAEQGTAFIRRHECNLVDAQVSVQLQTEFAQQLWESSR